jgi:uncharacterized membrane protein/uncharacterized protein YaaQ
MSSNSKQVPPNTNSGSVAQVEESARSEPVWTYRGYSLRSSEFTTAMVHMYRGEITRSNAWRQRLDATTNWAVVTTGATITIAFNLAIGHHSVIFLNMLLVTLFLYIESRRYLYYELWSSRIRLMETDFFAAMLVPPFKPAPDWAEGLADNLLHPHFPISMWEGFGRRFRRNYMWIYIILALAWFIRVGVLPEPVTGLPEFLQRAAIGSIPGWTVMGIGLGMIGLLMAIGLATVTMHKTTGEVLPHFFNGSGEGIGVNVQGVRAWFRHSSQRPKLMAHIVTDQEEAVAGRILRDMQRGVTSLKGTGMYSGASHTVLLCALTNTEVNQLKKVVRAEDPKAFVIVSPVQEILGNGFSPLDNESDK